MGVIGPFGFKGGYNADALYQEIGKDQMSDGQDVNVIYGTLQKRNGSANINASALNGGATVTGIFDWLANSGTRNQIIVCGNKIFKTASLGSTPSDITGATTVTAGNNHTFASLNNIVGIFGGTDTPLQWTGAGNAASLAGSPPVGNIGVTANNFMFISGNATNPSRVWWSNASDPNTWTSTNFVDFRNSDGDSITALADFNQNLIIFKRRSIGILYTQTTSVSGAVTLAPLNQIPAYAGASGPLAWDHLPDGRVVFLGSNAHVYIFDGNMLDDISDRAVPESSVQTLFDALPAGQLGNACVQVYPTKRQVWFSVATGSSTTNNAIYIYDYQMKHWLPPFTNINANVLEAVVDTRTTPSHAVVMCTGTYLGFMTEQDKGATNVEVTDTHIDGYGTVSVLLGPEQDDFEPKAIIVPYEGQSTSTILSVNYGFNGFKETGQAYAVNVQQQGSLLDSSLILDTGTVSGSAVGRVVIPLTSSARIFSIQVQLRNQNPSQPFVCHGIYVSDEVPV